MITEAPANKAVKEPVPYSHHRVYMPRVDVLQGVKVETDTQGRHYARMPDGSLRKARVEIERIPEGSTA